MKEKRGIKEGSRAREGGRGDEMVLPGFRQ